MITAVGGDTLFASMYAAPELTNVFPPGHQLRNMRQFGQCHRRVMGSQGRSFLTFRVAPQFPGLPAYHFGL
jgi:hypothetical protein